MLFAGIVRKMSNLPELFKYKTEPFAHQKVALEMSWYRKSFALFMDMGTGKTKLAIDTACALYLDNKIDLFLVEASSDLLDQWKNDELPIHCSCNYAIVRYKSIGRRGKKYLASLKQFQSAKDCIKIILVTHDIFTSPGVAEEMKAIMKKYRTLWVIDESVYIKNHNSKRSEQIHKLSDYAAYKRIMTGTPISQSILDLWSQFRFLDTRIIGYSSFFAFRARYANLKKGCMTIQTTDNKTGEQTNKIINYQKFVSTKNKEELMAKIRDYCYKISIEQCMSMPQKISLKRYVPLEKDQLRLYKEVLDRVRIEISSGEKVDIVHKAARIMKLQQVVCGFLLYKDEETDENRIHVVDSNRANICVNIANEVDSPVVIYHRFKYDRLKLINTFKENNITYTLEPEEFKTGKFKIFIGQIDSKAEGLNFQIASVMIFYSNSFRANKRWQAERRIYRAGQKKKCLLIDLVSAGTIDERIIANLDSKKDMAAVIDDLEQYVMESNTLDEDDFDE